MIKTPTSKAGAVISIYKHDRGVELMTTGKNPIQSYGSYIINSRTVVHIVEYNLTELRSEMI